MITDLEYLEKLYQNFNKKGSGVEVVLEPKNFDGLLRSLELAFLFNFKDELDGIVFLFNIKSQLSSYNSGKIFDSGFSTTINN